MKRTVLFAWMWACAAVIGWGVMFPVGDLLMKAGAMPPSSVAFCRYFFAAPVLFAMARVRDGRLQIPRTPLDFLSIAALGLIGSSAMALLLFEAQKTVGSVNASLLESWVPMQVMVLAWLAGNKMSLRQVCSVALGFLGVLLVLKALDLHGFNLGVLGIGDLFVFLSGLCWALYTACGRPLAQRMGGFAFTAWTVAFGAFWLLVWDVFSADELPSLPSSALEWKCILFLAAIPTALSFLGWNEAQKGLRLSTLGFLEYFPTLVAAAVAVAFFNDALSAVQWVGVAIVLFSAWLQTK